MERAQLKDIDYDILAFVESNPECSQNQVFTASNYSYSYCYQRIKRPIRMKKLEEIKKGNKCLLTVTRL